jgi:hypothetical protein
MILGWAQSYLNMLKYAANPKSHIVYSDNYLTSQNLFDHNRNLGYKVISMARLSQMYGSLHLSEQLQGG